MQAGGVHGPAEHACAGPAVGIAPHVATIGERAKKIVTKAHSVSEVSRYLPLL